MGVSLNCIKFEENELREKKFRFMYYSYGLFVCILSVHARDEWNILSSAPFVILNAMRRVFKRVTLRCEKDLVKRLDERL